MLTLTLHSSQRVQCINIAQELQKIVTDHHFNSGVLVVYCPHTTAGLTINESFDSSVVSDITGALAEIITQRGVGSHVFQHMEGNSDAHLKASLMGASVSLIVEKYTLQLGQWQGVFFCEFDGARSRKLFVQWLPVLA